MEKKLSAEEAADNFASHVRGHNQFSDGLAKANIARYAWRNGYEFGRNEVMEHYTKFVAMQPPQPIVMDRNEISLSTYKMFIRENINRDSQGKWWLKIKLWWRFLWIN